MKGQRIREIRRALGLSGIQFAQVLGVHPTSISRWENSKADVVVDGVIGALLLALDFRTRTAHDRAEASVAGVGIARSIGNRGVLRALHELLIFALELDDVS